MLKSQAVEFFGGPTKLGALLGLTRQAIHAWPEVVPDLYQYKLHHMSEGQLPLTVDPPKDPEQGRAAA